MVIVSPLPTGPGCVSTQKVKLALLLGKPCWQSQLNVLSYQFATLGPIQIAPVCTWLKAGAVDKNIANPTTMVPVRNMEISSHCRWLRGISTLRVENHDAERRATPIHNGRIGQRRTLNLLISTGGSRRGVRD